MVTVGISKNFKLRNKLIFYLYKFCTINSTYIYTIIKLADASFDEDALKRINFEFVKFPRFIIFSP